MQKFATYEQVEVYTDTADDSSGVPWKPMVGVRLLSVRIRRHNKAAHRGKKEEAAPKIRFNEISSDHPPLVLHQHPFQRCEADPGELPLVFIFVVEEVGAITDSFYRGENLLAQVDALLVGQHASAAEPYDRPMPVTERDHVVGRIDLYPRSPRPAFHDARHREVAGFGSDKRFLAAPASRARGAAALRALRAAHLLPSRFPARPPWDQLSASQALAVEDKSPLGV